MEQEFYIYNVGNYVFIKSLHSTAGAYKVGLVVAKKTIKTKLSQC